MKRVMRKLTPILLTIVLTFSMSMNVLAASYSAGLTVMNCWFSEGQSGAYSNVNAFTFSEYSTYSKMTSINVSGYLTSSVNPTLERYINVYDKYGDLIGYAQIYGTSSFNVTIYLTNVPTNNTFYIELEVWRLDPDPIGAVTLNGGNVKFNFT